MHIKVSHRPGFTLVEIMIVVGILGLLTGIALPNYLNARTQSYLNTCISNLRQIDAAKQQWAVETKASATDIPNPDGSTIRPYLGRGIAGSLPSCPAGNASFAASYSIGDVGTAPACQIDATHVLP